MMTPTEFQQRGYTLLREVLDPHACAVYAAYALNQRFNHHYESTCESTGARVYQGRYNRYADPLGESLLVNLQARVERVTGLTLLPTYSFLRIYETGAELRKHTDRPACEISASLTLGYEGAEPWPLWLEHNDEPIAVTLAPGDALLYRGRELAHWREPFAGRYCIQLFLHYVDAHGPCAIHKYDGRPMIGLGRQTRQMRNAGKVVE